MTGWLKSLSLYETSPPQVTSPEDRLNRIFIKSVEETISQVLGGSVAEAFGHHLYATLGLSREEIPSHLKEFSLALDRSFGVSGRVLARAICRRLYAELSLSLVQKPGDSFVECVEDAKKMFLKGLKQGDGIRLG